MIAHHEFLNTVNIIIIIIVMIDIKICKLFPLSIRETFARIKNATNSMFNTFKKLKNQNQQTKRNASVVIIHNDKTTGVS